MKSTATVSTQELRQHAEELLRADESLIREPTSPEETQQLIHELRVHQIQLEMQNDELHRVHAALDASQARYFDLYDLAPIGYLTLNESGMILESNLAAANLLGVARGALIKQPLSRFVSAEHKDSYFLHRQQILTSGASHELEVRVQRSDGSSFWAHMQTAPVVKGECRIMFSDISERKQMETYQGLSRSVLEILIEPRDLQDSMKRVITVIKARSGLDAIGLRMLDGEDYPYFAQDGFSENFLLTENSLLDRNVVGELGRDRNGNACLACICGLVLSGKTYPSSPCHTPGGSFWTNDSTRLPALQQTQDRCHNPRNRCIYDGYASIALVPIRARNKIVGLLQLNDRRQGCFSPYGIQQLEGVTTHIGEVLVSKQVEAALHQALADKSALVREIHHRVKNNLATMVSLINMQAREIKHPETVAALADTKARLFSMSLLHEMLYSTGRMDEVEFQRYLERLCEHLSQSLGMEQRGIHIHTLSSAPVTVAIAQAVPCGLLVSELVTNAIKHAFPDGRQGEVIIDLVPEAAVFVTLRVTDNGVGLPDGLMIDQVHSVGLTLVNALTRQLGGTLNIRREPGTSFEIRFRLQPTILP